MSRNRKILIGYLVFAAFVIIVVSWNTHTYTPATATARKVTPGSPEETYEEHKPIIIPGYSEQDQEAKREDPVAVSSDQMVMDYQQNEVMADLKYKGKSLEVSGMVYKISRLEDGEPLLVLSNYFDYGEVAAVVGYGQDEEVAKLRPGSMVSFHVKELA